jgi:hypothetical protein
MITTNLIALTGRARAGKDHIAGLLGLETLSIADPLYEICAYFLGSCNKDLPQHRRFLQLLGAWGRGERTKGPKNLPNRRDITKEIRKTPQIVAPKTFSETKGRVNWEKFGKNAGFWLEITKARVQNIIREAKKQGKTPRLAIPNVRFTNELRAFEKLGFLHLHVLCNDKTLRSRRGKGVNTKNDNDITEAFAKKLDLKMVGPQVIWNDPNFPPPAGRGYTIAKNLTQGIDIFGKSRDSIKRPSSESPTKTSKRPKENVNKENSSSKKGAQ